MGNVFYQDAKYSPRLSKAVDDLFSKLKKGVYMAQTTSQGEVYFAVFKKGGFWLAEQMSSSSLLGESKLVVSVDTTPKGFPVKDPEYLRFHISYLGSGQSIGLEDRLPDEKADNIIQAKQRELDAFQIGLRGIENSEA